MDFDILRRILDEAASQGIVRSIFFHIMGEPLLYPSLAQAVRYANEKGLETVVTTNGVLLTSEVLGELRDAGLTKIILSLQTPDEKSFEMRGAKGVDFTTYSEQIRDVARQVMREGGITLELSFLSSPLRRLILPVMADVSIADTSGSLRQFLSIWAEFILKDTEFEATLPHLRKSLRRVRSFKQNTIELAPALFFKTRVMGDWSEHSIDDGVRARFGYCPGIRENFGVLWNGDIVFCCVDYEGRTSVGNIKDMTLMEALAGTAMQGAVKGFDKLRIVHPHCQRCLGDKNRLHTLVRQVGSIVYFKGVKKFFGKKETHGKAYGERPLGACEIADKE
jgi:sulfatase maturation enzyme AslB (radical SAM superfamily)